MTNDVNEFLMSAGVTSAKFENIGDMVKGTIEAAEIRDQTDFKTGEVKRFPDGNPMRQIVITLQTDQHDSDEDDGMRRVFAKGAMLSSLREAIKKSGEHGIGVGGQLAVKYIGDGERRERHLNPPKLYQVWYKPPPPQQVSIGGGNGDPFADAPHPVDTNDEYEPF